MIHVLHHTGFKKVLKELVVNDRTPSLDLNNHSTCGMMGIHVEGFIDSAVKPKQYRYGYFIVGLLGCLDLKTCRG